MGIEVDQSGMRLKLVGTREQLLDRWRERSSNFKRLADEARPVMQLKFLALAREIDRCIADLEAWEQK